MIKYNVQFWDKEKLNNISIHEVRNIARGFGVKSPTSRDKGFLISEIIAIQNGSKMPYVSSHNKGRPIKANKEHIAEMMQAFMVRERNFALTDRLTVNSPVVQFQDISSEMFETKGYLDILPVGNGFLRENLIPSIKTDCFIPMNIISKYHLKAGDLVKVKAKKITNSEVGIAEDVILINGQANFKQTRNEIAKLEKSEITKKLKFKNDKKYYLFEKAISLGEGERILISGDNDRVIDEHIYELFKGLEMEDKIFINFGNSLVRTEKLEGVYYIDYNFEPAVQLRTLEVALNYLKRLVEYGKAVSLFVNDSLAISNLLENSELINLKIELFTIKKIQKFFEDGAVYNNGGSLTCVFGINKVTNRGQVLKQALSIVATCEIETNEELSYLVNFPCVNLFRTNFDRNRNLISQGNANIIKNLIYENKDNYLDILDKISKI